MLNDENKCPFCGASLQENARFCPFCMTSLNEKEKIIHHKRKLNIYIIISVCVLAFIILSVFVVCSVGYNGKKNRNAVLSESIVNSFENNGTEAPNGLSGDIIQTNETEDETETLTESDFESTQTENSGDNVEKVIEINDETTTEKSAKSEQYAVTHAVKNETAKSVETTEVRTTVTTKAVTPETAAKPAETTKAVTTETTAAKSNGIEWYFREATYSEYTTESIGDKKGRITIVGFDNPPADGIYIVPAEINGYVVVALKFDLTKYNGFNTPGIAENVRKIYLPPFFQTMPGKPFNKCVNLSDIYFAYPKIVNVYISSFADVADRKCTLTIHCPLTTQTAEYYRKFSSVLAFTENPFNAKYEEWDSSEVYN